LNSRNTGFFYGLSSNKYLGKKFLPTEMLKPKMAFNTFFGEFETPNLHIEGMVKWLLGNFNANFELLDSGSSPLISHHNRECRLPEFRKNEFRLSSTSSSNPVNGFDEDVELVY
jgi:hypothetical protein